MTIELLPMECCDCGVEIPRNRARPRCPECAGLRQVRVTITSRLPLRRSPVKAEIHADVDACLDCGATLRGGDSPWCIGCAGVRYGNEQRMPEVRAWLADAPERLARNRHKRLLMIRRLSGGAA